MSSRISGRVVSVADRKRVERRRARRVAPARLTPCLIRPAGGEPEVSGSVHNLSVRGAGLLSAQFFAAGEVLTVLFINAAHTFAFSTEFRVVRSYRVVNGDYFLGGQFPEPLHYDELLPFVV
jgi:hypothetical protein